LGGEWPTRHSYYTITRLILEFTLFVLILVEDQLCQEVVPVRDPQLVLVAEEAVSVGRVVVVGDSSSEGGFQHQADQVSGGSSFRWIKFQAEHLPIENVCLYNLGKKYGNLKSFFFSTVHHL
jgi:hypothetical protein